MNKFTKKISASAARFFCILKNFFNTVIFYNGPDNRQKGQSTVEFALMIIMIMLVIMSFMSLSFLGAQGIMTKFASYTGARGYLAYSSGFGDNWQDGVRQNAGLIFFSRSEPSIEQKGEGVKVSIQVQELFPVLGVFSQNGLVELESTTELGQETEMSGDNVL